MPDHDIYLVRIYYSHLSTAEVVEQGQIESFCDLAVGDNLVRKMQVSVLVRDGIVEKIEQN